jgi:FkbM family methyltransferase
VKRRLSEFKSSKIFDVSDLISASCPIISEPWFVSQQRAEWVQHRAIWIDIALNLADNESEIVLLDILRFRLTAELRYMQDYTVRLDDQYFEEFLNLSCEVFVDAGGFDGETSRLFIERCPNYKNIYFYEPSQENLKLARFKLSDKSNINYRALALSDSNGKLTFNSHLGSASAVTSSGEQQVDCITLDSDLAGREVSFIKMDLEGWELSALNGAIDSIRAFKPKLAIAVYHHAKDVREIFALVKSINPDYKVYLRHYTEGWSETIMYFV